MGDEGKREGQEEGGRQAAPFVPPLALRERDTATISSEGTHPRHSCARAAGTTRATPAPRRRGHLVKLLLALILAKHTVPGLQRHKEPCCCHGHGAERLANHVRLDARVRRPPQLQVQLDVPPLLLRPRHASRPTSAMLPPARSAEKRKRKKCARRSRQRAELAVLRAVLVLRAELVWRPPLPPFPLVDFCDVWRMRLSRSSGNSEARVFA
jgi:hypothetical protein